MNHSSFFEALLTKVMSSLPNDYSDNDNTKVMPRAIITQKEPKKSIKEKISNLIPHSNSFPKWKLDQAFKSYTSLLPNLSIMEGLYNLLDDDYSRDTLVSLMAWLFLNHDKIKLPLNTVENNSIHDKLVKIIGASKTLQVASKSVTMDFVDLTELGLNIKLNFPPPSAPTTVITFFAEQYNYKKGKVPIAVDEGDIVIDCGGFVGDTALYFANKTGKNGRVYCFEFIPSSLLLFAMNMELNPALKNSVELVQHPVWSKSGVVTYYIDKGGSSQLSFDKIDGYEGSVETETIDDMVQKRSLPKVDFIKMDIEGAELNALHGAEKTIRQYKPKLAIALYHSFEDFGTIPNFINSLGLGYKFYLDHFSLDRSETMLFAIAS